MRSRGSESLIVLPLLPIFSVGAFPMLLFALLGPAGIILLGIVVICAGLTDGLSASTDFSERIIVHGYGRRSERAMHATDLHSATRFALVVDAVGAGLVIAGICGLVMS